VNTDITKTIELVAAAMIVLDDYAREVDDEGSRLWSDEDSWDLRVLDPSMIEVSIHRCEESRSRRWCLPDTPIDVFGDELHAFIVETFGGQR
jgi:hypothetical protein